MGKVLKVLTVIVFLLSIVAFVLGMLNFNKRKLLVDRTHELESSVIKLASTLEAEDPKNEEVHNSPEYDEDEVSEMPNDDPKMSEFWDDYRYELEQVDSPKMNLNNEESRFTLRQYYFKATPENPNKFDKNGEPQKDSLGNLKIDGEGTMKNLLNQVQDRANKQSQVLGDTRKQLKVLREELEKVILLLNEEKKNHRNSKATISSLNKKIADLEVQIEGLNKKIAQLEREKLELNDKISSLESELAQKNEEISSQASEISTLKEEIKRLSSIDAIGAISADGEKVVSKIILSPGKKGEIVGVKREFNFVVVQLTDETMKELLGDDLSGEFVPIEVMVIREGYNGVAGNIVTRIRINRISRDGTNLGYADNLYGWEQIPVEKGDIVIY